MPDLLFELGCEELPASQVARAFEQLKSEVCGRLQAQEVGHGEAVTMGTPRRLILSVSDVDGRQPDMTKESRGPAVAAAFDAAGNPTKALEGFCRGQGVEPGQVETRGEHVWVVKSVEGRKTEELLPSILTEAVGALTFDKTMRAAWGKFRFARPIRWILASFGGQVVPLEIEGVASGLTTKGHRFEHPEAFEVASLDALLSGLRARMVEPDPVCRRQTIVDGIEKVSSGKAIVIDALVDENTYLTEWPSVLMGEFPAHYLELPGPVLKTVMAKHEKFFPVANGSGGLTNKFVSVRNGGQEDAVRNGNVWVLNARFNDAKFFYEEDIKHSMDSFLERTSGMNFQEKLGTVRQRATRLESLARKVAEATGAGPAEADLASAAGRYAKVDLTTGLVSELDELQGVIGGEYLRREGADPAVCHAVSVQYDLARCDGQDSPTGRTGLRLIAADNLDRLAGFLGLGLVPTGSSDPFGLRRSVTQLIELAWAAPSLFGRYTAQFDDALAEYEGQGVTLDGPGARTALNDLFRARYESILSGHRYDLVSAACLPGDDLLDPGGVLFRLKALESVAEDTAFVQTATRPANIVAAAVKKGILVDPSKGTVENLESDEGTRLWDAVSAQQPLAVHCATAKDVTGMVQSLQNLAAPINAFFDSTMVMVEDVRVRDARLGLLERCRSVFALAGDFTKVVIEG